MHSLNLLTDAVLQWTVVAMNSRTQFDYPNLPLNFSVWCGSFFYLFDRIVFFHLISAVVDLFQCFLALFCA